MTLTADSFNVMEYLWGELTKAPDPHHITFTQGDIDTLWEAGFVDTERHSLDVWRTAFAAQRRPDGNCVLTKADFLAKDKFRYRGEIRVPFDALKINEGMYTDEGLQELIAEGIGPSVRAAPDVFEPFFTRLKQEIRESNNLLRIDMAAKRTIRAFIEQYPSPLRRLELIFDYMIQQQMATTAATGQLPMVATPEQLARIEASTFTLLPDNPVESSGKALKGLQKAHVAVHDPEATRPTTPLKQIRRSRKGTKV